MLQNMRDINESILLHECFFFFLKKIENKGEAE